MELSVARTTQIHLFQRGETDGPTDRTTQPATRRDARTNERTARSIIGRKPGEMIRVDLTFHWINLRSYLTTTPPMADCFTASQLGHSFVSFFFVQSSRSFPQ